MTNKKLDQDENELARLIVHAVQKGEGSLVGALSIARELGLRINSAQRRNAARELVYDLMPLAVSLSKELYPGSVLIVNHRDRVYRMTTTLDGDAVSTVRMRMRKAATANRRAADELSIAKTQAEKGLLGLAQSRCAMDDVFEQISDLIMDQFKEKEDA